VPPTVEQVMTGFETGHEVEPCSGGSTSSIAVKFNGELPFNSPIDQAACVQTVRRAGLP